MKKLLIAISIVLGMAIQGSGKQFVEIGLSDGLFNDQVQSVCVDAEGLTWAGTRYGLSCSDGQKVSTYFPSRGIDVPAFSNSILSVGNDGSERIYFVTKSGFAYYDKRTDSFVMPEQSEVQKTMWIVKCLSDGQVLIGHDAGLARYDAAENRVREYSSMGTDINVTGSVKSIIEDSMGQVWIGTWGNNFYRYSPQENKLYHYPTLNPSRSAFTLCQDGQGNIWVGSWDNGLYRLNDPYNLGRLSWQEYNTSNSSLHDNRIYAMAANPVTGQLWVGHRKGVSVHKADDEFALLTDEIAGLPNLGEVDHISAGPNSEMWLGTLGMGAVGVDMRPTVFAVAKSGHPALGQMPAVVTSVYIDRDSTVWAGFGAFGVAKIGPENADWVYPYEQIGFGKTIDVSSVYAMVERRNGEMWLATYNGDVVALDRQRRLKRVYVHDELSFTYEAHILEMLEDSEGNLWVTTTRGAGLLMADGSQRLVGNVNSRVSGIGQLGGDIYFATTDRGLYRCPLPRAGVDSISAERVELEGVDPLPLLTGMAVADSCLLISSETDGIYEYRPASKTLMRTNYFTPSIGTRISSMLIAPDGTLWIATNRGLYAKTKDAKMKFTTEDGLISDVLVGGMHWRDGQMALGTSKGVMQFDATRALSCAQAYADSGIAFGLVGLAIGGCDFNAMTAAQRREATGGLTPYYAERISLPPGFNSVTLDYGSPAWNHNSDSQFACMLQGYDSEWRVGETSATYSRLPYGKYTFKIKDLGSDMEKAVLLVVERPWYHSYWAYAIYILAALALLYGSWVFVKHREREKAKIRVLEMEKESMQQVNHTKLVFFTNVTHELLTPLTVISAGIDELKASAAAGANSVVSLMDVNVKRLIKLMQQILEFRKAESNNLRLKVSYGDASRFVSREADALRPLINKKHQTLTVNCPDEPVMGYYDSDKLGKILYNLLSNAAKYTGERGRVDLTLSRDGDYMEIRVADTGSGIPKDKMKDLFTRFYDGEYREFKTIGTGIGLSLTRDLVELNHGTIAVESEEGAGTTFTVRLPIEASHFGPDEMQAPPTELSVQDSQVDDEPREEAPDGKQGTVLIVEDNEDLRAMMVRLLEHDYRIVDAPDGRAALEKMDGRDVDIVITDVMMPRMDGLELTRRLKQDINTSHIPIIVLTAKNQTEDRAEAYECGADAYLSKPFNLTVLLARIRNLLKWRSSRAQDFKNQLVVEIKDMDYDSIDETFITRAIEIVEKHLDDADFEVPQFAKEIGMGKTTLFNKLKSLTGMNPTSFIRNVRLKASCKIMNDNPRVRISDLAYMVGFSDPKYFSICFKREFGMTPTAYAENATPKEE